MQFTPKSKEELDKAALFPKGTYDIECYDAEEKKSASGNPMMVLKHKVYVGDATRFFTDYLVLNNDMGLGKLYSFCAAVGLQLNYDAGELHAEDCTGKACKATFIQKEQKDKETGEKTGEFRNELRAYLPVETEKKSTVPVSAQPDPSEDNLPDVPF